jgi:hypothetical protein
MDKINIPLDHLPMPHINPIKTPRAGVTKDVKTKTHLDEYYAEKFIKSYFKI